MRSRSLKRRSRAFPLASGQGRSPKRRNLLSHVETLECRRVLATANSLPDFYEVEQGEVLTVNDYAAAVLADGPVAYWQLNETSGPTAVDSAGSHDGAIGPAVGLGVPGAPQAGSGSTAFDFSGTADRVTVPYDPALNPTQFTIEAWARVDGGQGTWRSVVTNRDQNPGPQGFIIYAGMDNQWQFWTGINNGWRMSLGPAVVPGEWVHLVGVFDGAEQAFYVNGELAATEADTALGQNVASNFHIGAGGDDGTEFPFEGDIDEVALFDRALSPADIARHYAAGLLSNDRDTSAAGDPLTVVGVEGGTAAVGSPFTTAGGGLVTVNADGSFSYDATNALSHIGPGESGVDAFSYDVLREATLADRLVGHWALDSGNVLGNQVLDVSGNGHNGTLSGGGSSTAGVIDEALNFGAGNVKIDIPHDDQLNPADFTVQVWARVDGGQGSYRSPITSRDQFPGGDQRGFIIYAASDNTWQFWTGNGVNGWDQLSGPAVTVGAWAHVVATFEATSGPNAQGVYTGVKTFYVDGQQVAQNANAVYEPNERQVLRLGGGESETAGNFFFNGALDDAAVWDRALSAAEVDQLRTLGLAGDAFQMGARVEIAVEGRNSAPSAGDDTLMTDEDTAVDSVGSLLDNDSDPEGYALSVTAVNGDSAAVGSATALPSGALVTVEADGTYRYDPNGAFESLAVGATATDSFTYTLADDPALTEGLTAHYRLDGNAADSSGNGHDGAPTGTTPAAGVVGDALTFNGTSDMIDIPYDAALNPAGDFSVSVWARVDGGAGAYRSPVTSRDDIGGDSRGFILYAAANNNWEFWTGHGGGGWQALGGVPVALGQWTHVTATFTATSGPDAAGAYTGVKSLYIDGALVSSATQLYKPNTQQPLRLGAGASEGPGDYFLSGALDDVTLWNRSLTADEIGVIHGLGQQGATPADVAPAEATATVTVTINGLNDPPTAVGENIRTDQNTPVNSVIEYHETFAVEAADAAAIDAAYPQLNAGSVDASIAGGVLSINSGESTVGVDVSTAGGADRTIEVDIGAVTGSPGSYNVGIAIGENQIVFHPGLTSIPGAFRVNGPGGFANMSLGFVPAVGSLHSFHIVENAATGEFTVTVTDGDNPANTFTTSFTNPASVGGAIGLRRSGPNNGSAIYDNFRVGSSSLLANDSDIDVGDVLQAGPASVVSAEGVTVSINPDGTFSYDPGDMFHALPAGATAVDTFSYTVDDGNGGQATADVTITIDGLNDAPLAQDDAGGSTDQNTPLAGGGLLLNDSDIDTGDVLSVVPATLTTAGGAAVTLNADGTFVYDPGTAFVHLAGGETAVDTFTYTVTDGNGGADTATVSVTVAGLDDPPVAGDLTGRTDEDTPLTEVVVYQETFDTDAADAAAVEAAYPLLGAAGFDASVAGGMLAINSGTANLPLNLPAGGTDRTLTVDVGAVTASPGAYNVGVGIGQNNIVFHPGYTDIPGAFRVEGPGGFGNTDLGFVPATGVLHTLVIHENAATGEFTITLTDGDNPGNTFTTSFTNPASVGGELSFRREGGNAGPAIYDNLRVSSPSLLVNDVELDAGDTLTIGPAMLTSTAGAAVTIAADGTFSYDPGDVFQWLAAGETATDTFSYTLSDGMFTDTATVTVTIDGLNDAPSAVDAGGPYLLDEGGDLSLSGSFTDPDASDSHVIEWDINGDGDFSDASGLSPNLSAAELAALLPAIGDGPASYAVTFRVADGTATVDAVTTLTVVNVAPTADVDGPASAPLGFPVEFIFTADDPSAADQAAGFTYTVNWNDGSPNAIETHTGGPSLTVSHVFASFGSVTVEVTAEDKDGGVSAVAAHTLEIVPVAMVGDDILATGTSASDRIIFYPSNDGIRVRYNNVMYPLDGSAFPLTADTRLLANGEGGGDYITVHGRLEAPVLFDGGEGNDYLAGGIGDDTLRGGDGNDVILAGEGNNFIDGGSGSDRLEGRDGDDTIFGGEGNDRLNGGAGDDVLDGGAGNDYLFGAEGNDLLVGGEGFDNLNGHAGNDVLLGGAGPDQLFGGTDHDLLLGGSGADRLRGDGGDDVLVGGDSSLDDDLQASLDALLAGGAMLPNVRAALDEWFASPSAASRELFEPMLDDGADDELFGGSGADTFVAAGNDRARDVRSDDFLLDP